MLLVVEELRYCGHPPQHALCWCCCCCCCWVSFTRRHLHCCRRWRCSSGLSCCCPPAAASRLAAVFAAAAAPPPPLAARTPPDAITAASHIRRHNGHTAGLTPQPAEKAPKPELLLHRLVGSIKLVKHHSLMNPVQGRPALPSQLLRVMAPAACRASDSSSAQCQIQVLLYQGPHTHATSFLRYPALPQTSPPQHIRHAAAQQACRKL